VVLYNFSLLRNRGEAAENRGDSGETCVSSAVKKRIRTTKSVRIKNVARIGNISEEQGGGFVRERTEMVREIIVSLRTVNMKGIW